MKNAKELLNFINESPSCFHAVANLADILQQNEFVELKETIPFALKAGGKYYVKRNGSSIIAFTIPSDLSNITFNLSASHSDSPTFKVKPKFKLEIAGKYQNLNTEVYGGPILSTWLDRPLSIAGRVIVKENNSLVSKLVNIDKDLLVIPNIAPHMNPEVNGMKYNPQIDMVPLFSGISPDGVSLNDLLAEYSGTSKDMIVAHDLVLYNRDRGHILGANSEYILAPQLDDLECAFGCLKGFISAVNSKSVNVYCCFDNEEVGSGTKQGAASKFLIDTVTRISNSLGMSYEQLCCSLASSFMVSADNAHAVHPSNPGKTDAINKVFMNEGVVIKHNANQRYTSDAISSAIFKEICSKNKVSFQDFTNRSDVRGGGTLGSISTSQLSVNSIDIGLAQLAMHSSTETAGVHDLTALIEAMKAYYSTHIIIDDNSFILE